MPFTLEGERAFGRSATSTSAVAPSGALIDTDKPCFKCGYSLRGMRYGGRCPECGLTITARNPVPDLDAAEVLPIPYFALLNATFLVMSGAFVGMFLWPLSGGAFGADPRVVSFVNVAFTAAWLAGVVIVAWPSPAVVGGRALGRSPRELLISGLAVGTQAGWLAGDMLDLLPGAPSFAHGVCRNAGYFGLAFACWQSGVIGERIGDPDAAERLKRTGIGFVLFALLGVLFDGAANLAPRILVTTFLRFSLACNVMIVLTLAYFALQLFGLGRTAGWAISNRRAAAARDQRLADRFHHEREAARRRLEESEPFGGPLR